jgi:hypothetical protein
VLFHERDDCLLEILTALVLVALDQEDVRVDV